MAPLKEQLGSGDKRSKVIDDACGVLDQEVADKGGLSGIAIKRSNVSGATARAVSSDC